MKPRIRRHHRALSARGGAALAACVLLAAVEPVGAAGDESLEGLHSLVTNQDTSPIPLGWSAGAAVYTGASPYQADSNSVLAFPGAIYMSPTVMYLGDRASATVYQQGLFRVYGRGRLRFDSLTPADHPEWSGLRARRWELEGGLGTQAVTPIGLVTLRADSDVIGRSRGQDALVSLDFPLLRERLALMPSVAAIWRSSNLGNYYYGGVSRAEATAQRAYYDVGATLSLSVALVGSYRFSRHWIGAVVTDYERYPRAIQNSPLIGKPGTYDLIAGFGYAF